MSAANSTVQAVETAIKLPATRCLVTARDRISAAHWDHAGPAENVELKDHILVLDYSGSRSIRMRERTEVLEMRPGTVSMLRSGRSGDWDIPRNVKLCHAYLSDTLLRHAAAQHGMDPRAIDVFEAVGIEDKLLTGAMERLDAAIDRGDSASMYASTLGLTISLRVLELFTTIANGRQINVRGGLSPRLLKRAMDFMNAHLGEPLTLDLVASELGISAKHFARAFRESKGMPPHRWLLAQRVERAKEILKASHQPLSDIAVACGFADQSHFTATFRKMMGATPDKFRKEVNGD